MAEETTVNGSVERITFHSEESGFCVLRVNVRGFKDLVTVVGSHPCINVGEWVEVTGFWVMNPAHGRQLKARLLKTSRPDTPEGMERYLASGLIKGIGPKYAEKLVTAFGSDVFDIIEKRPSAILDVDGIGKKRQQAIIDGWNSEKSIRDIMVFLYNHGVGTSQAFRIHKEYGAEAIAKVKEDPYALVRDIWGIGFKSADKIGASLGIAHDSQLRARAGIGFVLDSLVNKGHCGVVRSKLVDESSAVLVIDEAIVSQALDYEIRNGRIALEKRGAGTRLNPREPVLYSGWLHHAEQHLSIYLKELMVDTKPLSFGIDVEEEIEWVQKETKITLAPSQKSALRKALTSKVIVITGGPGVGKTTLVNSIVKIYQKEGVEIVLAAPTGRAAKKMSESSSMTAKTIHRLLEFEPMSFSFKRDREYRLEGRLFIIDEISMLDTMLAFQLIRAIPDGATLILVGDQDQLPSVGAGAVLRDIIASDAVPVVVLNEIFRQAAGSNIILNAHRVNRGVIPQWPQGKLQNPFESDFYFVEADNPVKAADLIVQMVSKRIPSRFGFSPMEDIQVLSPMKKGELGVLNLNILLQKTLNSSTNSITRLAMTYKSGDKVMQLVNNYEKEVYNGDIGTISAINHEEKQLVMSFDGRTIDYKFEELDEVTLSYACTIHKSQGSEFPCVIIPVHTQHFVMLQRNLLYTAITRGRKLCILIGSKKALDMAVKKQDSTQRMTMLRKRLL